jgi:PadR family transcriptional regulator, regulatory protein PadR
MARMKHQDLLVGLIRLHILHHAAKEEFYGQWMIHELARHGYTLSPGTLYPMLHALERRGYLRSREERLGRTFRRLYRATALGREANRICKVQVRELTGQGRSKAQERSEGRKSRSQRGSNSHTGHRRGAQSYGQNTKMNRDFPGAKS